LQGRLDAILLRELLGAGEDDMDSPDSLLPAHSEQSGELQNSIDRHSGNHTPTQSEAGPAEERERPGVSVAEMVEHLRLTCGLDLSFLLDLRLSPSAMLEVVDAAISEAEDGTAKTTVVQAEDHPEDEPESSPLHDLSDSPDAQSQPQLAAAFSQISQLSGFSLMDAQAREELLALRDQYRQLRAERSEVSRDIIEAQQKLGELEQTDVESLPAIVALREELGLGTAAHSQCDDAAETSGGTASAEHEEQVHDLDHGDAESGSPPSEAELRIQAEVTSALVHLQMQKDELSDMLAELETRHAQLAEQINALWAKFKDKYRSELGVVSSRIGESFLEDGELSLSLLNDVRSGPSPAGVELQVRSPPQVLSEEALRKSMESEALRRFRQARIRRSVLVESLQQLRILKTTLEAEITRSPSRPAEVPTEATPAPGAQSLTARLHLSADAATSLSAIELAEYGREFSAARTRGDVEEALSCLDHESQELQYSVHKVQAALTAYTSKLSELQEQLRAQEDGLSEPEASLRRGEGAASRSTGVTTNPVTNPADSSGPPLPAPVPAIPCVPGPEPANPLPPLQGSLISTVRRVLQLSDTICQSRTARGESDQNEAAWNELGILLCDEEQRPVQPGTAVQEATRRIQTALESIPSERTALVSYAEHFVQGLQYVVPGPVESHIESSYVPLPAQTLTGSVERRPGIPDAPDGQRISLSILDTLSSFLAVLRSITEIRETYARISAIAHESIHSLSDFVLDKSLFTQASLVRILDEFSDKVQCIFQITGRYNLIMDDLRLRAQEIANTEPDFRFTVEFLPSLQELSSVEDFAEARKVLRQWLLGVEENVHEYPSIQTVDSERLAITFNHPPPQGLEGGATAYGRCRGRGSIVSPPGVQTRAESQDTPVRDFDGSQPVLLETQERERQTRHSVLEELAKSVDRLDSVCEAVSSVISLGDKDAAEEGREAPSDVPTEREAPEERSRQGSDEGIASATAQRSPDPEEPATGAFISSLIGDHILEGHAIRAEEARSLVSSAVDAAKLEQERNDATQAEPEPRPGSPSSSTIPVAPTTAEPLSGTPDTELERSPKAPPTSTEPPVARHLDRSLGMRDLISEVQNPFASFRVPRSIRSLTEAQEAELLAIFSYVRDPRINYHVLNLKMRRLSAKKLHLTEDLTKLMLRDSHRGSDTVFLLQMISVVDRVPTTCRTFPGYADVPGASGGVGYELGVHFSGRDSLFLLCESERDRSALQGVLTTILKFKTVLPRLAILVHV